MHSLERNRKVSAPLLGFAVVDEGPTRVQQPENRCYGRGLPSSEKLAKSVNHYNFVSTVLCSIDFSIGSSINSSIDSQEETHKPPGGSPRAPARGALLASSRSELIFSISLVLQYRIDSE